MQATNDVDRICQERMKPIMQRMEDLAAELDRVRKVASKQHYRAAKAAAVDRSVKAAEQRVELAVEQGAGEAREEAAEWKRKAEHYRRRAYAAEKKLKLLAEGELDPYELMAEVDDRT